MGRVLALLLFLPLWAQAGPEALSARLESDGVAERVEIALSAPVGFRVFTLDAPPRVVVDFPPLDWRIRQAPAAEGMALIDGLRFGLTRGGARMVVDLGAPAAPVSAHVAEEDGARFVLSLAPVSEEAFAAAALAEAARARRAEAGPPTPRPRPKRGVIVAIDAGHGGRDAGASDGATQEKDLVLDYALRLADAFDAKPGFVAYLVRRDDEFIRLRERVARARHAGADVMISIHADALEQGNARGASVFTLSEEASDAEAEELVESHNRADVIGGATLDDEEDDVAAILVNLARRSTDAKSRKLAEALVAALRPRAPVLHGRALQSAGFRVLKAPDVPSVLVELGFLSAEADRARLLSEDGRDALIEALVEGVADWVATQDGPRFRAAAVMNRRGGG